MGEREARGNAARMWLFLAVVAAVAAQPARVTAMPHPEAGPFVLRHDRVEGLYAGLRGGFAAGRDRGLRAAGEFGYAGAANLLAGELSVGFGAGAAPESIGAAVPRSAVRAGWMAGFRAYDVVVTRDAWRTGLWEATLGSALLGCDPRDYHGSRGAALFVRVFGSTGASVALEHRDEHVRSLPARRLWNLRDREARPNPPIEPGRRRYLHVGAETAAIAPARRWRLAGELDLPVGSGHVMAPARAFTARGTLRIAHEGDSAWRGAALVRAATSGADAPTEWRHALGGVDALRGLGFNALRGSGYLLVSASVMEAGSILKATRLPLVSHLGLWGNVEWGRVDRRAAGSMAVGVGDLGGLARLEIARRVTSRHAPLRVYLRLMRGI